MLYKINWSFLPVVVFWWAHLSKAAPWFAVCWPICRIATCFSFFSHFGCCVEFSFFCVLLWIAKSKMFIGIVHCFQSAYFFVYVLLSVSFLSLWFRSVNIFKFIKTRASMHRNFAFVNGRTHSICFYLLGKSIFSSACSLLFYWDVVENNGFTNR